MLLFREQKRSKNLNIITGFQIIDGVRHIFIVEGLRNEGIKEILKSLPLDQNNGRGTPKVIDSLGTGCAHLIQFKCARHFRDDLTLSMRICAVLSNSSNTRRRTLPGFQIPSAFWKGEPKASIFNARGIWNPSKVRRRMFELTSQICIFQRYYRTLTENFKVLVPLKNFKASFGRSSSGFKTLIKH